MLKIRNVDRSRCDTVITFDSLVLMNKCFGGFDVCPQVHSVREEAAFCRLCADGAAFFVYFTGTGNEYNGT